MNLQQIKSKIKKTKENRACLFDKMGYGECVKCKLKLQNNNPSRNDYGTIDHIVPLSRGGRDIIENMQLLCKVCNGNKGAKVK
jgi:5-methylcytosine-specific restriction endonuclease McrA